ncbi:hypothetical protein GC090_20390 (plasmid) [Pantoea sp. JZ29]|uniref:hypothetical protein n=1 Tax=Pantoea sp. JZ29 TaxID=2654192 RepID=UPI002B4AA2AF|nr:hypothetical protein [Pantoea sp. JZ29]WRH23024.1 hypothetical protein GC090_20390 [Pantoea sp. JZ29]
MKSRILEYIDNFLFHSSSAPSEQLVYLIAKLSLTAYPVAWFILPPGGKGEGLFFSHSEAVKSLNNRARKDEYIVPLFATLKFDFCEKSGDLFKSSIQYESDDEHKKESDLKNY